MKYKLISILAGAIVLISPLITMPALAQTATPLLDLFPALSNIELTQEQQTQLSALREETRASINQILTPQQYKQFFTAVEQGQSIPSAIASMNLSPEQKTQLRSIFQSTRKQFASIITPEQRRQFLQNVGARMIQPNQ